VGFYKKYDWYIFNASLAKLPHLYFSAIILTPWTFGFHHASTSTAQSNALKAQSFWCKTFGYNGFMLKYKNLLVKNKGNMEENRE
jgi:hypothetical protein